MKTKKTGHWFICLTRLFFICVLYVHITESLNHQKKNQQQLSFETELNLTKAAAAKKKYNIGQNE